MSEEQWGPLFVAYAAGKDDQRSFDNMAARLNWSHEQTDAFIQVAEAAFRGQQHEVLAQVGIADPAAFRAWCESEESLSARHDRAITNQLVARSLEDFKLLAQEFVRTVVPSEEALRKAGYVKMMGHEVRFAINGFAAIEEARKFTPDVILLDIGLPDFKGHVIARQLAIRLHRP